MEFSWRLLYVKYSWNHLFSCLFISLLFVLNLYNYTKINTKKYKIGSELICTLSAKVIANTYNKKKINSDKLIF